MLRILHDTKIDFIRLWKITTIVTLLFTVPGIIAIAISGYQYSVEFTGGTLMQVSFPKAPDVHDVRSTLDAAGIKGAEIQTFGSDTALVIRAQDPREVAQQTRGAQSVASEITAALIKKYGPKDKAFRVDRTEAVGPKVGAELRQKALYAILVSFIVTLVYLAYRFEWRFGLAAVIATAHDILATIAFIGVLRLEVSLTVVAAVLSMVGYSLNDTIIIFDRVRENLRKHKHESFEQILNRSINETLPRSVLTHGTSLATLAALAVFGGEVIRPFALVMFFGVFTGTFSSIYIASPVLMAIEKRWPGPAARGHLAARKPAPAGAARKPQTVG